MITKDIFYAGSFVFLLGSLYLFGTAGSERKTKAWAGLILSSLGMILFRNEGRLVLLVALILMAVFCRPLRKAAMMLAAGVPICFDVNHLLGDTHEAFLNALAPHIATTHLSDYDGIDERHWLPGEGIVPWKDIFVGLMQNGYRGPFLFELKQGEDGPYPAKKVVECFKKALGE